MLEKAHTITTSSNGANGSALSYASLWAPARLISAKWLEHIPFAFWLIDAMRPRVVVELGIHPGNSYMAFCQAVHRLALPTHCSAVGHRLDEPGADGGSEGVYSELRKYNDQHYSSFSTLLASSSEQAIDRFADGSIDLLHIEEISDYAIARQRFDAWLPKMSEQGIVLLHGTSLMASNSGAFQLWNEVNKQYISFEFSHGQGLGVLAVGSNMPAGLNVLFGSDQQGASAIQEIYSRLGHAILIDYGLAEALGVAAVDDQTLASIQDRFEERELEHKQLKLELDKYELRCKTLTSELKRATGPSNTDVKGSAEVLDELDLALHDLQAIRTSTSWRITAPMRLVSRVIRQPRIAVSRTRSLLAIVKNSMATDGLRFTLKKIGSAVKRRGIAGLLRSNAISNTPIYRLTPPRVSAPECLTLRVLIIAETSIPQCLKYRVTQKQQMIEHLGFDCTVVSWTDFNECRNLLQSHSLVIFYRVPALPDPLRIIQEAKALGVTTIWEVDDLIFDAEIYSLNSNLASVSAAEKRNLLAGVVLYRDAMLACDLCIASTTGLAEAMRQARVARTFVVENALDAETSRIAEDINSAERTSDEVIRIGYGSGTRTHDADFRVVGDGIKAVLRRRRNVRLRIIGELNLGKDFDEFKDQIERFPLSNYATYLSRLAECAVNIAPLEETVFNDAKSNIKYLEASMVRLPSVCSPRAAFRTAIRHGETGFLAETPEEWEACLEALVEDSALRATIAACAYEHVLRDYDFSAIARNQVLPVLTPHIVEKKNFRILGVNIFFEPRSFGGATVVAEEMATLINGHEGTEYFMFTSLPISEVPAYNIVRYQAKGANVFGMGLPNERDRIKDFENPGSVSAFREALRAVRPNVVHLHSIQGIGALIAEVCRDEKVPFAVTLHDAWWICGRQFMITGKNRYCNQRKIDLDVCSTCVDNAKANTYRQFRLREILETADMLLAPSKFFRDLFVDNEFDASKIHVNKNGIRPPRSASVRPAFDRNRPLRFGYVGGETPIKGAQLIKKVFTALEQTNYELVVVDNLLNLGTRSIEQKRWACTGTLRIVPAYTQETIDDFFNDIDVLLFPTQWKESFGLTVREALVRDVWVIATDAGGVVEDIVAGENGDIVPLEDDGTALKLAVERLLRNVGRLDGYQNPYKNEIRLFDDQAKELGSLLRKIGRDVVSDI